MREAWPLAVDTIILGQRDMHVIEIATALLVLVILFVIYRNVVTMLVPLATIGLSLVTAQGVLSGLAEVGLPIRHADLDLDDRGNGRCGN